MTNPEILAKVRAEGGANFVRGFQNFIEDWERRVAANHRLERRVFNPELTLP